MSEVNSTTGLVLDEYPNDPEKYKKESEVQVPFIAIIILIICFILISVLVLAGVLIMMKKRSKKEEGAVQNFPPTTPLSTEPVTDLQDLKLNN